MAIFLRFPHQLALAVEKLEPVCEETLLTSYLNLESVQVAKIEKLEKVCPS